ncbi:N-acetylmuramic acid 6-phosphate etherase [Pedosphaera parvula]|uniref:N-acetylmuramic acid 6-phosphate etherase n=1 Tax=Pedosphaera parvula (strain Ellin514) TaxID=320771 RepID=B9XIZ4_PEDPL|nr:N-acetylmuramic acid 6-phosphate etherase [Pedosphaera parvula]EEF60221.1 glucokinase regulatory-like protein [Pedosphaera parvula Ellin514]
MTISSTKQPARPLFLGIEGGGTRTVALLADARRHFLHRFEAGPANVKLLNDAQLVRLLRSIAEAFPQPDALAIGMAGARTENDWERIRNAASKVWTQIPAYATNDLETALTATDEKDVEDAEARILMLSGTGSCCYGRNRAGKTGKIGGWGHILGDKGSGYEIGLRALKAVVFYYDRDGAWARLGQQLLHRLELNEPNELIAWAQAANKTTIASLATEVFVAWKKGDKIAADILASAESSLVEDAVACARQLANPKAPVHFILSGSVLLKQPQFTRGISNKLKKLWPGAQVTPLERESVWGAVILAQKIWSGHSASLKPVRSTRKTIVKSHVPELPLSQMAKLSPTEQRNPRSLNLDKLPLSQSIELMLSEDAAIPQAILQERDHIEQAVKYISQAFKKGGRLFYVGAGTSGRLGVLDASECPPTFRSDPEMVQGIIAGGQGALWRSVEGAEDDPVAGARAIEFRSVTSKDVVVGIAASGRTPFVWGALGEAKGRGARTILVGFNPFLNIPGDARPDIVITPNVGPELLTGSTRLKAGTATKLILNIFTTLAMVRIGKVVSNLMVDLNPSNTKLRDRAVRIIQELKGVDYATAQTALEKSEWVIKKAVATLDRRAKSKSS